METNQGALSSIRVVDFTTMMAGPYCTRYLADMGAEVIKIEAEGGDYLRTQAPLREGKSTYFGHLNAGKKSVVLDLKNPDDLAKAKALVDTADVVVENFRPGVMARFGLGYEATAATNPGLVYCAISGFGQTGVGIDRPAYAQIIQASSGYDLANLHYQQELTRPANAVFFFADVLSAAYATIAINAALVQRGQTGKGQMIDLSLLEGILHLMPYEVQEAQFPATQSRPIYRPFRTTDGFVMIIANTQRNFEMLARAMDREDLIADADFATPKARYANFNRFCEVIEAWTSQRTSAACEETLIAGQVPCARYRTVREAMADPQLAARHALETVGDAAGSFLVPNLPFKMTGAAVEVGHRVPELGADDIDALIATRGAKVSV
ncbi:CaiB/BaiF CoA transferase family protein [Acuticoccus mangrovi]|uniref:CoA transferase n=1 Tax=Acuticoccus mangrovi TaxID=2796142 RepID=A0A934IMU6_9HYPH|nr:CoA transferase [Acuticoccus mangrovi]MBJ3775341.1 CoA transferase [Acuticoccus mangrovi]